MKLGWNGEYLCDNLVQVEVQCLPIPELEFKNKKEVIQLHNGRFRQRQDFQPIDFDKENFILITFAHLKYLTKMIVTK